MTVYRAPRSKFTIAIILNIALFGAYLLYNKTSAGPTSTHDKLLQELQELHQKILHDQRQLELSIAQQKQLLDDISSKRIPSALLSSSLEFEKESRLLHSFQASEELPKTHDIAIPRDVPKWTKADTAYLNTVAGFDMMAEMLKQDYIKQQKIVTMSAVDFAWISRKERVYKSLWNHVLPIYQSLDTTLGPRDKEARLQELAKTRPEVDFFLRLEQRLFPWIQVFHIGEKDLSLERQEYIRQMTNDIEVLDITYHLDNGYLKLKGWAIKPFAILASRFEEAIFIDADAYFLRTPEALFDDPGYMATGSLFFYDRSILPGWRKGLEWIRANIPFMSNIPQASRSFRGTTAHEQESGVVVINKKRRLPALLSVCKMNSFWERDLSVYQAFYGDKETFYIGFELVQEPYAFVRNYGGVIGELNPDDDQSICGAQMHLDYLGRPLWWNSGLVKNKNNDDMRDLSFGYWMSGGGNQTNRELLIRNDEMKGNLAYELELDSVDDLPPPEEPVDPVWDYMRGCMSGWKVEALPEDEAERANLYVVIDKISKRADSLIAQHKNVDPSGDWDSI